MGALEWVSGHDLTSEAEHRRTKSSRDVLRLQTCRARRELSGDVRAASGVQRTAENGPPNIWRPLSVHQVDYGSTLVELGLGVRGPERVTGAWGAAARRRAHLRA